MANMAKLLTFSSCSESTFGQADVVPGQHLGDGGYGPQGELLFPREGRGMSPGDSLQRRGCALFVLVVGGAGGLQNGAVFCW